MNEINTIETALVQAQTRSDVLEHLAPSLVADKALILRLITEHGALLQYAPDKIKKDPEILEVAKRVVRERMVASDTLINVYTRDWLERRLAVSGFGLDTVLDFERRHGTHVFDHLEIAYFNTDADAIEFALAEPRLSSTVNPHKYRPALIFINRHLDEWLVAGIGRKTGSFVINADNDQSIRHDKTFTASFGLDGALDPSWNYMQEFTHADCFNVVRKLLRSLDEISEALAAREYEYDEDDEDSNDALEEEISDRLTRAVEVIQIFFPSATVEDFDEGDY